MSNKLFKQFFKIHFQDPLCSLTAAPQFLNNLLLSFFPLNEEEFENKQNI